MNINTSKVKDIKHIFHLQYPPYDNCFSIHNIQTYSMSANNFMRYKFEHSAAILLSLDFDHSHLIARCFIGQMKPSEDPRSRP